MAVDGSIIIDTKIDDKNLKSQMGDIKNTLKKGFGDLRDIMQGPVAAVKMLADGMKKLYGAVIGPAAAIEDMTAAFTPLVGSVEKADQLVGMLNETAATTPFQLEAIGSAAKQLLPILGDDMEAVVDTFRMLGDTAGGNAQKLESITRGYSKAMLKGKVDMESLNMIAEAGVPIYTELASSLGVTVSEMMELSSAGKITDKDLTDAFKNMTNEGGIFFGGMEISSQTLNGKLSTMRDNTFLLGAAIGDLLIEDIKQLTDAINEDIKATTNWINNSQGLKDAISDTRTFFDAMGKSTKESNDILADRKGAAAFVASMHFITDSIKGLIDIEKKFVAGMGSKISDISTAAAERGKNIFTSFTNGIIETAPWIKTFLDKIKSIGKAFFAVISSWDNVVQFFEETLAKQKYGVELAIADIKLGFVTAFNTVKIAVISLATIISEKLLGGISDLLGALENIPLVGKAFAGASVAVRSFQADLSDASTSAKNESAQAIKDAQDRKAEIEKGLEAELKAALDAAEARKKLNEERDDAIEHPIDTPVIESPEIESPVVETVDAVEAVVELTERQKELIELQNEYASSVELANQKAKDGFISQEEAEESAIDAARRYADALYSIGVSAESAAEDGGDALRALLATLTKSATVIEAEEGGEELGEKTIDGWEQAIRDGAITILKATGAVIKSVGQGAQKALSIMGKAISWAAAFDPMAVIDSLKSVSDGIVNFFYEDLALLPAYFDTGVKIVSDLVYGIQSNLDAIKTTADTVINTITDKIKADGGKISAAIVDILIGLALVVLANITSLLDAGFEIVKGVAQGIVDNANEIFSGLLTAIMDVAKWLVSNLPEVIALAVNLAMAIVMALFSNIDILVLGLIDLIPAVLYAVIESLPSIVSAFTMLTTAILLFMATQMMLSPLILVNGILSVIDAAVNGVREDGFKGLVDIGYNMIMGIWTGLTNTITMFYNLFSGLFTGIIDKVKSIFGIHSPSTVFADIGVNMIQGLINGITSMASAVWSAVTGLFSGIGDWISNTFSGIGTSIGNAVTAGVEATGNFFTGIGDGIADVATGVGSAVTGATAAVGTAISDTVGNIGNWIGGWFANGTKNAPGGLSVVGERGPEIVNLPQGSQVYSASNTQKMLNGAAAASAPMSIGTSSTRIIKISDAINIDGREIGRTAYEYLDHEAGIA